MAKGDTLL
ncbi:unnamed protein product [Linum tenue]|uniref:Uncharacterized protein n=1 Tax=Linum tenue TaxID=586396 RepID=A0AAV0NMJ3_9ROSI|nr:unnamed protein product [Linum tenue]CAI0459828.1 unnamed protein product [Linum tenue]